MSESDQEKLNRIANVIYLTIVFVLVTVGVTVIIAAAVGVF